MSVCVCECVVLCSGCVPGSGPEAVGMIGRALKPHHIGVLAITRQWEYITCNYTVYCIASETAEVS